MKSSRLLAAVVMAMLAGLLLALPASSTGGDGDDPLVILETRLTGEKEVPGPGDPDGFGRAVVRVFPEKLCYSLEVERIAPATAAHIHVGFRREAGPVVVTLKPPTDGFSRDCLEPPEVSRALNFELNEHPGRYYINVHNDPFPAGAIRGQLHTR
jgi:hypothetical protein